MRTTAEISADIAKVKAADRAYNRVLNEGGEGYERDSTEVLEREWLAAQAAEFAAVWTLETLNARRSAWNAEMLELSAKRVTMTPKLMDSIIARLGYSLTDIKRAKALHGV